jgi:hypothetical protein
MLTKVNNDSNGNPRYVCHFLSLLNDEDRKSAETFSDGTPNHRFIETMYRMALTKSKKIGGRKFSNKSYGGGIVFQTFNAEDLSKKIQEVQSIPVHSF